MTSDAESQARSRSTRMVAGIVVSVALGLGFGIATFTFVYAKGWSYLTNDPAACANCHVMQDHYDAWLRSSHRSVAACNDCHVPHELVAKYWTKAEHGFRHSYGFTTGDFHEPIQIKASSLAVVEDRCRACHADVVHAIDTSTSDADRLTCVRCHRNVGHPE